MAALPIERLGDELAARARVRYPIAFGSAEDIAVDAEMDRRLVVRRRDEDASAGIDLQAEHRRRVEIVVEDERLVLLVMALQVFDQAGRPRPLPLQPLHLVGGVVRIAEKSNPSSG